MERPCCRSHPVSKQIQQHEDELTNGIDTGEYLELDKALKSCEGVDIAVKLRKKAETMHLKLEHELKIRTFLAEKDHHDNYKDIRKDVQRINDMVQNAQDLQIDLDSTLVADVNAFTSRLISERNLRKQRDLYIEGISTSDKEKVDKLQSLIDNANQNAVEKEYVTKAEKLTSQMSGNINARETLQML